MTGQAGFSRAGSHFLVWDEDPRDAGVFRPVVVEQCLDTHVLNTNAGSIPATRLNDSIAAPRHMRTVPSALRASPECREKFLERSEYLSWDPPPTVRVEAQGTGHEMDVAVSSGKARAVARSALVLGNPTQAARDHVGDGALESEVLRVHPRRQAMQREEGQSTDSPLGFLDVAAPEEDVP